MADGVVPTPSQFPVGLLDYLDARIQARGERVRDVLAALTERERRLVREVAVMANVRGMQRGQAGQLEIPGDTAVVTDVIDACLGMPDLYPTISGLDDVSTAEGRDEVAHPNASDPKGADRD
jgi:hypothetical protein